MSLSCDRSIRKESLGETKRPAVFPKRDSADIVAILRVAGGGGAVAESLNFDKSFFRQDAAKGR